MRARHKIISLVALVLACVVLGLWRESAVQNQATDQADCDSHDPLSACASGPQSGYPAGELVVLDGPELSSAGVTDGSLAVIRFAPKADAVDISKFLDVNKASVIEGPKNGGMYTIRLPVSGKDKNDLIKQMQAQSTIVEFIATVQ
jgi:hypothetical protein